MKRLQLLGRWWRPRRRLGRAGVATLDFAIVGGLFLTFMVAIAELGFGLYAQVSLDYATKTAARQLMTGRAGGAGATLNGFRTQALCPALSGLIACNAVYVTVYPVNNYRTDIQTSPFATSTTIANPTLTFNPGASGSLMYIQTTYIMPTALIGSWLTGRAITVAGVKGQAMFSAIGFRNDF